MSLVGLSYTLQSPFAFNIASVLLAFILSAWITRRLCHPDSVFQILDHPNERSLHAVPTPRTGGIAICVSIIVVLILNMWWYRELARPVWLLASLVLVAGVSFLDDRIGISVIDRLLAHLLGAALLLLDNTLPPVVGLPGIDIALPMWLAAAISIALIVWLVNLYNFMDGMDGFAAGMAVVGFGAFAILGWNANVLFFCGVSLAVAAASAGFLLFNFPPARIFMGDVGSASLGLLVAALSLWGIRDGVFTLWTPLLIFSPFIVDATVTLARRAVAGEKVWQAHRTHYYQRLVRAGWGHRKTVLWEYGLMLTCAASALWGVGESVAVQWVILGAWIGIYTILIVAVTRLAETKTRNEAVI